MLDGGQEVRSSIVPFISVPSACTIDYSIAAWPATGSVTTGVDASIMGDMIKLSQSVN